MPVIVVIHIEWEIEVVNTWAAVVCPYLEQECWISGIQNHLCVCQVMLGRPDFLLEAGSLLELCQLTLGRPQVSVSRRVVQLFPCEILHLQPVHLHIPRRNDKEILNS